MPFLTPGVLTGSLNGPLETQKCKVSPQRLKDHKFGSESGALWWRYRLPIHHSADTAGEEGLLRDPSVGTTGQGSFL